MLRSRKNRLTIFVETVDNLSTKNRQTNFRRAPTAFERRVYNVIRRIPRGQTRSYAWVARQLRKPGAARAVGQALKRNPFAPRIPCHRVVRSDGSLGGYSARGGLRRKRRLLARERQSYPQKSSDDFS